MNNSGVFAKLRPLSLLRQLSNCSDTTCLQASSNSVSWLIYLEQGKITYATHSVEPFDRLERHLRRLSHQIPLLTNEVRVQVRLMFEPDLHSQLTEQDAQSTSQPPEYQAIYWLVSQQHLHSTQAAALIQELVKEVIESFLLIKEGSYELSEPFSRMPKICRFDIEKILERCQARLESWQSFGPQISSPYQRPYLLANNQLEQKDLPNLQPNLTNWMKGFSICHLAAILNQDEIKLARQLYPYIVQGRIILHEPDPPFDKLPKLFEEKSFLPKLTTDLFDTQEEINSSLDIPQENDVVEQLPQNSTPPTANFQEPTISNNINSPSERVAAATVTPPKIHKIVSVDDSPTILKEISHFLENENFSVVTINDPLKAVLSIIRHKPDLILLDLNMAGIDGYELCKIIRNNSMFKQTPIIFVTGNKGIVDKVKARLVGASGYLTKPFTQADLLKIVFMHLT
ncbi:chemotaxis protein CheY [Nostoc linckia z18]|jgi:two-component system, chemotaxis family, response regulator PixG|uniref:Protein PatA n=2 Tax=Nostoc linckia TaxID=92942 RepID=A0A9Q6EII2_NOSLI|nr:response regulator [Nostoc linckia]PHK39844.1 chemotaxis protein CheY [Nostoc linckia z15]PHK46541.1 chemotaxis protein CheY [Nostoc linckia z16]PHJ60474.1 chemotaxis protein CheY [Nostoc linckia z1]PHJ64019.1 chemotaxis protein CheY [Nostoc linckia z3]PHJ76420.1 chemotaxis protein CheY [Nostoc linckia z2]